jgi:hypothetical protein
MEEGLLYRQFVLRKHLGMNSIDLRFIEVADVNKFLEWNEDEAIQAKIDQFGAAGCDITKPEAGEASGYYRKWIEKQQAKYADQGDDDIIDPAEMRKKAVIYRLEIDRVMGRRELKPEISGTIK